MRECGKCKSNEYTNKNLVMMVNECGHPLCKNCVENLFSRNAGPCHVCGKTLRRNNFWEQVFDDPLIEKETHIRRRLRKASLSHQYFLLFSAPIIQGSQELR
ncbi:zinc finger, C3HC4 type [Cooperia oncophora]